MIKEALRNTNGVAFHTRCAASVADVDAVSAEELFVEDVATSSLAKQKVIDNTEALLKNENPVEITKAMPDAGAKPNDTDNSMEQKISDTTKIPPKTEQMEVNMASGTNEKNEPKAMCKVKPTEAVDATGAETLKRKSCEISKAPVEGRDPRGPVKRAKLDNVQIVASK
eukprot:IDg9134t1